MSKIFNNFSRCEILILQMVELDFLGSKFFNFTKLLIIENESIIILFVSCLGNWIIFQIRNFWNFF